MDVSPLHLALKNKDDNNLKSNEVKNSDNSPATSNVKSVKATGGHKAYNYGSNKFSTKAVSKSQESLARKSNQKDTFMAQSEKKKTLNMASKSPSSLTLSEKSKIPQRSPFNNSRTTPKIVTQPTPKVSPQAPQKTQQQKVQPEKKQFDLNLNQIIRSKSKSSLSRSESLQTKGMAPGISKSSFTKQTKRITKSQSARSSSVAADARANTRSASNMSARSTPCTHSNSEREANLRKMISTAGDYNRNETIEKNRNNLQNELLQKSHEENTAYRNDPSESIDEFRCQIKTYLDQWFLSFKNELMDSTESTSVIEKMEQLQVLQVNDILSYIDNWCAPKNEASGDKLKKEIEKSNKSIRRLEQKHNDLIKQHEEERLKFEKHFVEKTEADLAKKEELQKKIKIHEKHLTTLKTTVRNLEKEKEILVIEKDQLEEDLKNCSDCSTTANKKLHEVEQYLKQEKMELKSKSEAIKKLENELVDKNKLETELAEVNAKLQDLQSKLEEQYHNECVEHTKQISELTNKVSCLETDNEAFHQRNEKLEQDINGLQIVNEKLVETENKLQNLQRDYDSKEIVPDNSKEVQMELAKLRQSEAEKSCDINKLKKELSKTQFNVCQLEQQIERDQHLLEVRSSLINSLQANEKTHRIHIEELFAQMGEKNNSINELNNELQTKSEESHNLFATLSAKQIEMANQEHIIKLLEESNERSQMLRIKQEEKIGRMEEQLARLKQIIAMCKANVLTGNSGSDLLFAASALPSSNVDFNENFYYYASQRKRKRQININVKKYET